MPNIMTTSDLGSPQELLKTFKLADAMRNTHEGEKMKLCVLAKDPRMEHRLMATVFMEPSTRTRMSFEAAMLRLGGKVMCAPEPNAMSVAKGESIAHTIETVAGYANVIVVRASDSYQNWFYQYGRREWKGPPVINGGDGPHNHPTQALTDAYTIWRQFGKDSWPYIEDRMTHCVIGDVGKSRTIKSYLELLAKQPNHTFWVYDSTGRGAEIDSLKIYRNIHYLEKIDMIGNLKEADIIYINRVQRERHSDIGDRQSEIPSFQLGYEHVDKLKKECVILDPGPVSGEMTDYACYHDKNKMFEQSENGMYVRMAMLRNLLS